MRTAQPSPATPAAASPEELAADLKRCAFLLNSAQLVITDPVARTTIREAVSHARSLLARVPTLSTAPSCIAGA